MPPALVGDLEEEVLLRFPPEDPAALVRAALVCKRWRRLVSGPGFRRRFAEFHRTAPMLGIFCNRKEDKYKGRFVPTTAFLPHGSELGDRRALDARHGRVLLREGSTLVVWDPITDEEWKLPFPPQYTASLSFNVTVLCSAAGCGHLDCHRQPFIVVFVASVFVSMGTGVKATFIYTYSSDAAAWSEPICGPQSRNLINPKVRSALVGNTLYFGSSMGDAILKYNMQLRQMSWIQLPFSTLHSKLSSLTTTEDGGLQLSIEDKAKLCIWFMKDANEVDVRWEQNRVIKLNTLFPDGDEFILLDVVGSTDGLSTIFVRADDVSYAIDLKTYKVKKVYEDTVYTIIPYISFYTPVALQADGTGEGSSVGGSSA